MEEQQSHGDRWQVGGDCWLGRSWGAGRNHTLGSMQELREKNPGWVAKRASIFQDGGFQPVFRMLQTGNISPKIWGHKHKVAIVLISQEKIKKKKKKKKKAKKPQTHLRKERTLSHQWGQETRRGADLYHLMPTQTHHPHMLARNTQLEKDTSQTDTKCLQIKLSTSPQSRGNLKMLLKGKYILSLTYVSRGFLLPLLFSLSTYLFF